MRKNGSTLEAITRELVRLETEAAIEAGSPIPERKYSVSTISRELRRNRTKRGSYNPEVADEMAQERSERVVHNSALKPGVLQRAISLLIEKRWSPEQISGYLKKQGVKISKERIYQEIRMRPELHKYCHHKMKYRRHKPKAYKKAGKSLIPNRVSIHDRPVEADGTRFGDWEMDLVIGKGQKSAVLTVIERSRNMFMQKKLPSKKPEDVAKAVISLLVPYKNMYSTLRQTTDLNFVTTKTLQKLLTAKYTLPILIAPGKKVQSKTPIKSSVSFSLRALISERYHSKS